MLISDEESFYIIEMETLITVAQITILSTDNLPHSLCRSSVLFRALHILKLEANRLPSLNYLDKRKSWL